MLRSVVEMYINNTIPRKKRHNTTQKKTHPPEKSIPGSVFSCAPGGARFQPVQVRNPPGSGKDIAEGKGVHREVESEGSRIWGTY